MISVRQVNWQQQQAALSTIRSAVFIEEQQVPPEMEWDQWDAQAIHFLAYSPSGEAIGTARLLHHGHIGRMAVLQAWRHQGVGSRLLQAAIAMARRQGLEQAQLSAQTQAIAFYEKHGFHIIGEEFLDAGIPHFKMLLNLTENNIENAMSQP